MSEPQAAATPHPQLIAELLDSRIPKTEREHAAAREIDRLRAELANLHARDIHSCWDECQRPMCVLRRERDSLRAELAEAKAQAVADDVVRDARLGNLLHVWDYDNPEDGHWDNIEEYLNDTTPNAGETVRLNLAMPLQDVEIEMIEVGKCGEPIRWEVRDAKTGALLAAQQQKEGSDVQGK